MSAPCATQATPTGNGPTTGNIGLFRRIISKGQQESTKRAVTVMASVTLCGCTLGLALATEYQAAHQGEVDGQLVLALLGMGGWTAGLAGVAYRKPDSTEVPK